MDTDASNVVESDADILAFEVPDDVLERAAVATGVQVVVEVAVVPVAPMVVVVAQVLTALP